MRLLVSGLVIGAENIVSFYTATLQNQLRHSSLGIPFDEQFGVKLYLHTPLSRCVRKKPRLSTDPSQQHQSDAQFDHGSQELFILILVNVGISNGACMMVPRHTELPRTCTYGMWCPLHSNIFNLYHVFTIAGGVSRQST